MASTRGTQILVKAGIAFTLHPYRYDPKVEKIGLAAAEALGLEPGLMLKTLIIEADGQAGCCVIPSDASLSMKRVALAFGAKQAAMMAPERAAKLTGYHVGGISPFGMMRRLPIRIERAPCAAPMVWINAGQRGLLLGIAPSDALQILGAQTADLSN